MTEQLLSVHHPRSSVLVRRSRLAKAAIVGLAGITGLGGAALPFGGTTAHAAEPQTIEVTNRADDGSATSLRAAIDTANAAGGVWTIQLRAGAPYVIDRQCAAGDLDDNHGGDLDIVVDGTLTIVGDAPHVTIQVACANERIIDHRGDGTLVLRHLRLTGGNAAKGANGNQNGSPDGRDGKPGGAVLSESRVELHSSLVEGNRSGDGGAGAPPLFAGPGGNGGNGGTGGAIAALELIVSDSVIRGNSTGRGGNGGLAGGAFAGGNGGDGGPAIAGGFGATVTTSDISGNTAGNGGNGGKGGKGGAGGHGGDGGSGAGILGSQLHVEASTVSANVAGSGGAAGEGNGAPGGNGGSGGGAGGIWMSNGTVSRSTIHANRAGVAAPGAAGTPYGTPGASGMGGGMWIAAGPGAQIEFSTITGNSAFLGANIATPGATSVRASVIGQAIGSDSCLANLTSAGWNVFDSAYCGVGPNDRVVGDLGLGELGDNGGPTPTRLPAFDGPLVGAIPEAVCRELSPVTNDQRQEVRPVGDCEPGSVELPPTGTSRLVPLPPQRVFDTRVPGPLGGFVPAGTTITVPFAGVAGVPATGATAVAFNLTIDGAAGAGYVTAFPTGTERPLASSLNTVRSGQTVPNMVIVPIGANGSVDFFTQTGGHLLADVVGYFEPAAASAAGRIVPLDPTRVFDTRDGGGGGKVGAGESVTVEIGTDDGVPAGAGAVVLNVTATEATAAGFVTVYPADQPQPLASTLNLDGAGHTAANLTIVPLPADGRITLFSQSGAHLLADITGYVTGTQSPVATEGLVVPLEPRRVFDTRTSTGAVPAAGSIDVTTAGVNGVPADAAGVILNVTAADATAPGFVTAWPAGGDLPLASTLNLTLPGETRANAAILPVGADGALSYFSQGGAHLLADIFGYVLPAPPAVAYID